MKISEYKQLFLSEAEEILNSSNNVLVELEKEPTKLGLLNELFRLSHTLKSMAQSMGYEKIAKLTHSMESALALLRSGELKTEKGTVGLLFKSVDTLSDLVEEIRSGETKKVKLAPLVERFKQISSAIPQEERKSLAEKQAEESPSPTSPSKAQTVRIPLTQIDSLMDLTGELVTNRIRLTQIAQRIENASLKETVEQLSRLISQLQDEMMQIRLVPLEYIFTPYPRLVRNMAKDQNKEVDLLIECGDIGLDRTIQDEINEPLLHLLKNAVTHGIEKPKEREELGKPKRGKIKLVAKREKNSVVIKISDDGYGIDIEEIKQVAPTKGIISKKELETLSPEEVVMLITDPGYSRVKEVTEAAGRGVGLNVVKTKVETLKGTLDIDTKPNEGTTFSIKLPLTMAIIQVILVEVAKETYCIPLSYIAEIINVSPQKIKTMEHHEIISYRDTVFPLVRLKERLGFARNKARGRKDKIVHLSSERSERSSLSPQIPVVIVEAGSKKAGLIIDSLLGQQEAVIKPLTGMLNEIEGISGATILGTGKVALILDVPSLL